MKRFNSIVRGNRHVMGTAMLGLVLVSGGCSMSSALVSSLSGAGLSILTALLSSLLSSVITPTA